MNDWQYPIAFAGAPHAPIGSVMETDFGTTAGRVLSAAISETVLVGHAGFAEALLGSVSQHCVHHARCPVVIIRGSRA